MNIVILTGAGISSESGLETFRDKDGIWAKVNIDEVATPEGFVRNPERVHQFYNKLRSRLFSDAVQPNAAHYALAKLEREWTGNVLLVTQNIDNLHERAGSQNLIHMHGELLKVRCTNCLNIASYFDDVHATSTCPKCSGFSLRPHLVWFGEVPMCISNIIKALKECDLFIAIGTSGNVYPAAGFVEVSRSVGAHTVELNLEPSISASRFDEKMYGTASEIVVKYVERLLNTH